MNVLSPSITQKKEKYKCFLLIFCKRGQGEAPQGKSLRDKRRRKAHTKGENACGKGGRPVCQLLLFGAGTCRSCGPILAQKLPGQVGEGAGADLPRDFLQEAGGLDFLLLRPGAGKRPCCIFDPGQGPVAALARRWNLLSLSWGFAPYDTLVLSSYGPGQAVLSLQREIYSAGGRLLEPGDFVLLHQSLSPQVLLPCGAALLLLDQGQEGRLDLRWEHP